MIIGSNFYNRNIAVRGKLPKHVKVIVRRDVPEKDQHAETVVFDQIKNKKQNNMRMFSLARFDFQARKWMPKKDSPEIDILNCTVSK